MRLDRFLSNFSRFSRQDSRLLISAGRLRVDGEIIIDPRFDIRDFQRVELDDELLQAGRSARYWMLHKPVGVVSATEHDEHRTVLDLLDEPDKHELHLAGRLDLNTSGLLLITNDGLWSRRITQPQQRKPKVYHVTTEQPITEEYAEVFARGLYFAFEDLTTLPAQLDVLDSHHARLTLFEGRYHQVKRMFGHFRNRVVALHRESMGEIVLDPQLAPGQYRALTAAEIASV
ncbi:pseudouridine synthase [Ectopseudomonas mendocina]|uniref:pseudouridine synthase n=1 Tax=Ectopseudomonas mendocina TaxID=300 RepID=UPI000206E6A3|nr:pseudouridine synthase [Pseudomonas mendocina]AEB57418.1 ribosomal small subunit pseudouridine synthase A [Pseudomonas mendocina NK-01]QTN44659.1 pseudouridine synthase [Pseudomonas mendocina]